MTVDSSTPAVPSTSESESAAVASITEEWISPAIMAVIRIHPKLHQDRGDQYDDRGPGKKHFLRRNDLGHAFSCQLHAQKTRSAPRPAVKPDIHSAHGRTDVWHLPACLPNESLPAKRSNCRIRQVVYRIRRDGNAMGDRPRRKFKQT